MNTFLSIGEAMVEMSASAGGGAGDWRMGFAGDTLNTAWHARQALGPDWRVSYFTALGDDRYSALMLRFIADAGLDTSAIVTIPGRRPGLYFIHQQDGDRQFTYWRDTSAARLLARDGARLQAALADAGCIYLSGITLAILTPEDRAGLIAALVQRRAAGPVLVCLDPNIRPQLWAGPDEARDWITRAAAVSDIVLPSFADEAALFGDADPQATAARYAALGAAEVAVKDGGGPTLLLANGAARLVAPPPVAQVVDATGAGDSFNGGYLAARLTGAAPDQAVGRAQSAAAACLGYHGAIPRA